MTTMAQADAWGDVLGTHRDHLVRTARTPPLPASR